MTFRITADMFSLPQERADPTGAPPSDSPTAEDSSDVEAILTGFLSVLDSLERLTAQVALDNSALDALRGQMLSVFEQAHAHVFGRVGDSFDPHLHQAVGSAPAEGVDDFTIIKVIERGCRFNGKVLRCAQVIVARSSVKGTDDLSSGGLRNDIDRN